VYQKAGAAVPAFLLPRVLPRLLPREARRVMPGTMLKDASVSLAF
jgi:hypothetical protein